MLGGGAVARAGLASHLVRHLGEYAPDLGLRRLIGKRKQPLLYDVGCFEQQLTEQPRRNIGPQAHALGYTTSACAWPTNAAKLTSESCAVRLRARLRATSRSPRFTRTSVTGSAIPVRLAMASRWA